MKRMLLSVVICSFLLSLGAVYHKLSAYESPGSYLSVDVVGTTAYTVDPSHIGLQIIDVSNPLSPVRLGFLHAGVSGAVSITVIDTTAYVATHSTGLKIIDVSNPQQPILLGYYDTPGYALSVDVVGTLAYVADSFMGLQIIDVSNPQSPMIIGS